MRCKKPEYLLPEANFTKLMEDRTAAAAGNSELEELECWAAVEAGFRMYLAMAWNTVLLQVRAGLPCGLLVLPRIWLALCDTWC